MSPDKTEDEDKDVNVDQDQFNEEEESLGRVILPNKKKGEMFGIVEKMEGASRLSVMCEDGYTRNARIPGRMRKRMWIREKDLVIVKPWEFQPEKADVVYRYTKTQASYLSRNHMLPEVIDIFK
ncbi:translation initiation factor eIF1A [Thermoplasma volcanium GSS1]|uniref:Translation initiation factor 1A n=1 Tax=Thermoplasma volcanium (strain ATCC 51530 / DSM 4299 / JCM 9571 / NBRC 15438 / GSS1) TaxID=273116 RepID=IF1A_THEVO|nr:translation initiation factor eIF-1A [Thermoplasma volcanium]Q979F7.1 RecName: Full=Translation initiation factor 1A; Short=aIF-1A [Thermoplasma volcanium GSS1]BAB60346.1 translation initiation factor eIF1A [Thermoplasma volcanium GSS1]